MGGGPDGEKSSASLSLSARAGAAGNVQLKVGISPSYTTRRSKPLEKAAAQAAARPGSEVAPTQARPITALASRAGSWARLRRRRAEQSVEFAVETALPVTGDTPG